jgi:putative ABC transport system substrate-binding protein
LRELGWTEKENIQIEYRWAHGMVDQFSALAAELVALRPDLIAVMSTPGSQAVHRATSTIPVVMISVSDPVASGLVASLARPGGNVTGVSNFLPATTGKLLEFLRIVVPRLSTVGLLYNPTNPGKVLEVHELRTAANGVGVAIEPVEVRTSGDFDGAFSRITQTRCEALITLQEGVALENRSRITGFATKTRLPTIFQVREYVDAGGLMSYGLNFCQHFRSAATYVDKILRGARPGDLPIELPTSFELLINLKTAKAIGLEIPRSLLLRADEVIK